MDLREFRARLLTWADQKAWQSSDPICSNTLNLVRFYEFNEESEVFFAAKNAFEKAGGLFSLIHEQSTAYCDEFAPSLKADDLLGVAYYLSRYKGALREYALNRLCLRFPILNDKRSELDTIIENPKGSWSPGGSSGPRFLYNNVSQEFGDQQELPCSLGGTWSSLMLAIPDYQVSFRSDKRIGNLTPLVLEMSAEPWTYCDLIEYTFCGEGQNISAELLIQAGEIIYGTQFKMHKIRNYVLDEKHKSRFIDQMLAYPDSWMLASSDHSILEDELLGDRLSHLFVSSYLAQPIYQRLSFLERYGELDLVETAGSVADLYQRIKKIQSLKGEFNPPDHEK